MLPARVNKATPAEKLCAKLAESLQKGNFARLVLSAPVAQGDTPHKILGRFVMLKGVPHLSLTLRYATRDVTKNLPVNEGGDWLQEQLGRRFHSALLCTTAHDWQYLTNEAGEPRLIDHQPSTKKTPSREHNRRPAGILDASARDWLLGLEVLDAAGQVRISMADKHRQINHYLEILSHLAKECGWLGGSGSSAAGPDAAAAGTTPASQRPELVLADMGCGKGYLTFGSWHLFHRVWRQPVRVIGIESRGDLVTTTNKLARRIGAEGLEFHAGTIASARLPRVDGLIALHACNTATDDAILRGVALGAKLIVVAPCCHKELRPQLGKPAPLAPLLVHGLMQERLAEWLTDGLRALFLEWAGYRTKVMEFVAGEHTPKNLMIAAVHEREPFKDPAARQRITELKAFFGVGRHALDPLLAGAWTEPE